jgi:hypothetical protein
MMDNINNFFNKLKDIGISISKHLYALAIWILNMIPEKFKFKRFDLLLHCLIGLIVFFVGIYLLDLSINMSFVLTYTVAYYKEFLDTLFGGKGDYNDLTATVFIPLILILVL